MKTISYYHPGAILVFLVAIASTALAFHSNTATKAPTKSRSTPSRPRRKTKPLQYRDDASPHTTAIEHGRWRKLVDVSSRFPSRCSTTTIKSTRESSMSSEAQETVDTYLEFLDRRYSRLHADDNSKKKKKRKTASTTSRQPTDGATHSEGIAVSQDRGALYVLGVAGLASEKLLRTMYRRSIPEESTATTVSAAGATNPTAFALTTLARASTVLARLVLRISGGQRAVVRTIAMASALAMLARSLFQIVVTNGLSYDQFLQ